MYYKKGKIKMKEKKQKNLDSIEKVTCFAQLKDEIV